MKKSFLSGLLAFFATIPAFADPAADYAALTAGLTTVPGSGGTPGALEL